VRQISPFLWGYGHYVVFAAAASIGAGMEVGAAWTTGDDHISARLAAAAVTVPTALFYLAVWALQSRFFKRGRAQALMPMTAAAVLLCTWAGGYAVILAGLCCAGSLCAGVYETRRADQTPE
jgi:Bacterial low temperature requirement A protein (LtrA)